MQFILLKQGLSGCNFKSRKNAGWFKNIFTGYLHQLVWANQC
jgi:hypothetical protein